MPPPVDDQALRASIRAAGLRATAARVCVLRALSRASGPVSHADVCAVVGDDEFDRATIYRNLVDLTRVNLARRSASGNATRPRTTSRSPTALVVRPRAALVELVPVSRPGVMARYVVHVGELRVEVGDDFAPEALRRIVEVLRAC